MVSTMLVRSDPFRDLDRFTQQILGTAARPAVMTMDAWRDGDEFVVEFDLPGIEEKSLDLDIERNVVTVRAERPDVDPGREMLATERPRGVFSRQLVLGDNLDTERIQAVVVAGHVAFDEAAFGRRHALQYRDGTGAGFDLDLVNAVSSAVGIPVIASSGAGEPAHFREVFEAVPGCSAALAAGIFHRHEVEISEVKRAMGEAGIPTRVG